MRCTPRRALAAVLLATSSTAFALPAFPGAEGFGANAQGGARPWLDTSVTPNVMRVPDVYHVTTLADDPNHAIPGSLFYGLYTKNVPIGGRTIVFDVGGTISLGASTLDIKNISHVTIAGQTAPSPITIINNTTQVTSSTGLETGNIIVQYLTFRKGTGNGDDAFHIQGNGNTHDIIVDHVSGSWSEDEVISATQNANNVTVQNSIMSEALTSNHAYGSLIRPQQNVSISYNRNLYSNQKSRNPRPGTYDGMTLNLEFQNNVIYNWSDRAGYIAGADGNTQHLNMNYVGNYLIAGPSAVNSGSAPFRRDTAFIEELSSGAGDLLDLHIYQQGNKIDNNSNLLRDGADTGWNMFRTLQTNGTYTPYTASEQNASPFAYPGYATADPADIAYAKAIASVDAFPYARSTTDTRLINDVLNYTGFAPVTAPPADEWNAIVSAPTVSRPANWDTDRDGMPNDWELQHGFNPALADNNTLTSDGYTRLEHYLQSMTAIANWNLNADGVWSDYLNWRGDRPTSADATANFIPGITASRTVSLDIPASLGQLSFNSPTSAYTLAGPGALSLKVIAGHATVNVLSGNHTISAPLSLLDDAEFTIAASSSLTLTNLLPTSKSLTKLGPGTLATTSLPNTLICSAGTVQLSPNSPAATVTNLTISPGASLDLTNSHLTLTTTPQALRQHLLAGRITSSTPDPYDLLSIGYSSTGPTATLQLTYTGDANLDGVVNPDDYALLDRGFAKHLANWQDGDFNYDGIINDQDYALIDRTFILQGSPLSPDLLALRESQFGPDYVSSLLTSLPEPSSLAGCGLALLAGLKRKRR